MASNFPLLFSDKILTAAIYRYSERWLPLILGSSPSQLLTLVPPLDIALIWIAHMINPIAYKEFCRSHLSSPPIDCFFLCMDEIRLKKYETQTYQFWNSNFGNTTPFHLSFSSPPSREPTTKTTELRKVIIPSVHFLRQFTHQVSGAHFGHDDFLLLAKNRYRKYLYLVRKLDGRGGNYSSFHSNLPFVPTFDIHLMILAHLVTSHVLYESDIESFLGGKQSLIGDKNSFLGHLPDCCVFGNFCAEKFEKMSDNFRFFSSEWKKCFGQVYARFLIYFILFFFNLIFKFFYF